MRDPYKVCSKCGVKKPRTVEFFSKHFPRYKTEKQFLKSWCRLCSAALNKARRARPEVKARAQEQGRLYRARLAKVRSVLRWEDHELDALRRALVEKPEALSGEPEMAAYFQGFMAASRRAQGEAEGLEAIKDLIHRIAAQESRGKRYLSYDESLSAAYEGALSFLRSERYRALPLEERRKQASIRIRGSILDWLRSFQPLTMGGRKEGVAFLNQFHEDEDGKEILPAGEERPKDEIVDLGKIPMKPRTKFILERLARGDTKTEIAKELGISQGRVFQLLEKLKRENGEALLRALDP